MIAEIWDRLAAGGVYMIPIFLVSTAMLTLVIRRGIDLWLTLGELKSILDNGIGSLPADSRWQKMRQEYREARSGLADIDADLRDALASGCAFSMGSGNRVLLYSSLATLLGLLGTVSGMIASFEAMHILGVGTTKSMASGISEALVTTQCGLLVGVAGLLFGRLMARMNARLERRLRIFFIQLEEEYPKQGS
ncbi:MAG: MotA/TolQ/ExbB proton channel family protein [Mailhella sp.]|nr:MotA/TolQ/ExbB proton channel family protein [Mailhella sp.]